MNKSKIRNYFQFTVCACFGACVSLSVHAQDEQPAISSFPGFDADPVVETTPQRQRRASGDTPLGSTIVGESESPIGLYITPWRNSAPQADLDRPAKLVHEAINPLEPEVFKRHVKYHAALTRHRSRSEKTDQP